MPRDILKQTQGLTYRLVDPDGVSQSVPTEVVVDPSAVGLYMNRTILVSSKVSTGFISRKGCAVGPR